jgi:hypothetical protein
MSLWSRIRGAFSDDDGDGGAPPPRRRGFLRRLFSPPPPSAPPSRPRSRGRGWDDDERGGDLPPGWKFESLYHYGTGITKNTNPSDSDISGADSILVSYTDSLGTDYRWIHGATGRRAIGRLIQTVTIPDSPVR